MDRIYVMDHGHIHESGTFEDLARAGTRFAGIFAEQI